MKKNVIWKSIETSFVIEKPKNIFHSREIHQRELRSQKNHGSWFLPRKIKIIISNNKYSEKTLFKNWNIEKKDFLIFCKTLRTKICWSENHATSLFWKFSWKSVSWWKIPWKLFWFKKFHGNQFRWFQKDQIEFFNGKFPEVCSAEIASMKTVFKNGETRTKTISLTGKPDGPISYKCNARKLVFLKANPPISSIGNPRKVFSTTKKHWKSISSKKNPIHNLPWKNVHGKTSVDRFSL